MIQILAIAPYEGLAEALALAAESRNDFKLTVKTGNLQAGLEIAKASFYKNFDIVLSRGGTARLLRQELDIPVVEIPLSVYDMLRAIKLAENYNDKFAIVGYDNITHCAHTLCDLLQYQIDVFTINDDSDVSETLTELKEQNYHMVLCDMISSISARQIGMNSILITSGPESIKDAFDDAIRLYHSQQFTNMQKELFRTLIFESDLNVLLFNEKQELMMSSFGDSTDETEIVQFIKQHISYLTSQTELQTERKFKSYILSIHSRQLQCQDQSFYSVYITKKESVSCSSTAGIYTYSREELAEQDSFSYCGNASYVGSLRATIDDYSASASPVLIIGECGTGKDRTATILFETGLYCSNLFHMIDCKLVSEKKWVYLLENESSPFCSLHSTIYLKNIQDLTDAAASKLIVLLRDTNVSKRNRLIFSILADEYNIRSPFADYLMNQLTCLTLRIPPLRERQEDIPNIASICINQLNALLGKTIIGFHSDALALLQSFSWPQNLEQFKRILKELVTTVHTPYITKEATQIQLKKEIAFTGSSVQHCSINLDQTLEEINYDIAHLILKEEHGSKGRTAERLGISRSTLWRMLKLHSD